MLELKKPPNLDGMVALGVTFVRANVRMCECQL